MRWSDGAVTENSGDRVWHLDFSGVTRPGDYNKYTNWHADYLVTPLHSYRENPAVWTDDFNIPESGNGTPDLLDEVRWGMDWLIRMQEED